MNSMILIWGSYETNDVYIDLDNSLRLSSAEALPPSSMHSFLKRIPNAPHVVLTGFDKEFFNRNVGSESDNFYDKNSITDAATAMARILATKVGFQQSEVEEISANETLVSQLMLALVEEPNSSELIHELFPDAHLPADHLSTYSGIYQGYTKSLKQLIVERVLSHEMAIARDEVTSIPCTSDKNCSELGRFYACSKLNVSNDGKVCERIVLRPHPAYSAGFNDTSDEWKIGNPDKGPIQAESVWSVSDAQIVLLPSITVGRISIGIGVLVIFAISFLGEKVWKTNVVGLAK